jgi:hypothetical protein
MMRGNRGAKRLRRDVVNARDAVYEYVSLCADGDSQFPLTIDGNKLLRYASVASETPVTVFSAKLFIEQYIRRWETATHVFACDAHERYDQNNHISRVLFQIHATAKD